MTSPYGKLRIDFETRFFWCLVQKLLTIWATMGSKIDATAVLEAISVSAEARRHMRNITANGGKAAKDER